MSASDLQLWTEYSNRLDGDQVQRIAALMPVETAKAPKALNHVVFLERVDLMQPPSEPQERGV